ncbi:MAG TPA: sigma-70 family RNA polymerase sigma factor [Verrucomicrobiae bacterium]|nr:sigma-70 family RNA polymerase sigma factor [Verrucomicrobiae bacterium]
MVCGIALGILGDFAASEDVGQEVFLTAWRKIHDVRDPECLRAWLGQIARNAARGHLRVRKSHEELSEDLILLDASPTPDETAVSEEEAALVRESLAKLPETYRLPLVLYYREGKSVRAVAEALGISEDAVKQRLSRGREMCRARLSRVIETVLTRTTPSAVFTMSVAVAIGALAAPSAIASSAFGAGSSIGAASAGSAINPVLTSAMTISKGFLLTTAVVTLICIPIGYRMRAVVTAPLPPAALQAGVSKATPDNPPSSEDSELVVEWRSLHEKYGTNALAMPELYKAIHGLKDSFSRQALGSALISEWAQVDPSGGLSFLMGKGHNSAERQQFFREWLSRDPRAAVNGLMTSGGEWQSTACVCLKDIAQAAPDRVAEIAALLPKPDNYWDTNVRDAFAVVAEQGLDSARTAAETLAGPNRDQALAGVARTWGKTDLAATILWAKGLPDGIDRDEVLRSALVGKASVDPAGALDAIGIVPEGGKQNFFASTTGARVLTEAAQADFDGTVAWLASHPGRLGSEDLLGLAGAVTDKLNADPAGFLSAHAADGSLKVLLPAIGSALLNNSSGERGPIWDWLKTQPDGEVINSLRGQVLNGSAWQDPIFALKLVPDLPNTPEGNLEVQNLANSLFNGGSMLDRFDQLFSVAPDRLKTPLVETAFNFLRTDTLSNPQSWVNRLSLLPPADQSHGAASLAQAWAGQDPSQAITWANSLPQGDTQNAATAAIASGWASKDAYGAANWVASLPVGPERDKSSEALVLAVADQFPRDAWNWALSIGDTTARDTAAARVIQTMAGQDPSTARQWIDSGPFSPETKLKLQASLQKSGPSH